MAFRAYFIFLFLLTAQASIGQTVEWGNPQKIKQKNLYSQIVGECSTGIYILRCRNADFSSEVFIEKYRNNLSLEASQPAPVSINGNIERVLLVNDELHIFISARNTQTSQIDILDQKVDASLKAVGLPTVICSFPSNQFIEKRKIQIKTSANKKRMIMMFLTKSSTTGECKLNLYGYNEEIKQDFGKQFTLNESPEEVFITNFEMDNTGNAFVLIDFPNRTEKAKADNRNFFLYAFYPLEDKMLAYELGNSNLFIEELGMCINNFNHTVSVMGFYSEGGQGTVNGYFMERFSITKRNTEEKYASQIDGNFVQQITGGNYDKKILDLRNYYVRKIIPRSDGGVIMVAEKFVRLEQRYNYYLNYVPQEGVRVTYNYDDAILLSVNSNGSIHFADVIRKRQSSVGDGGFLSSVATIPTQDNIYVLYNSELDKDGNVMVHNVNYQGKSDEKIAVKSSNFSVAIIPGECRQTGPNSMLAVTIRDKQFTLMRITF